MTKRELFLISVFFVSMPIFAESYYFDPGDYYLLDGRINVRDESNLSGMVIGSLNVNSKVKIIECAFNEQIIDDVSAYWYKIEYNKSYGYIWGGYIAVETFVHDIDSNGTNDYFHFRFSKKENDMNIIDKNKDTFIYINGKLIKSNFVWKDTTIPGSLTFFNDCGIRLWEGEADFMDGSVQYNFFILDYSYDAVFMRGHYVATIGFRIDKSGNITPSNANWTVSYWDSR